MTVPHFSRNLADRLLEAFERLAAFSTAEASLAPFTTYKVGGPAAVIASPRSLADLSLVALVVRDLEVPVLVVGRGSNLLVADTGFRGVVVSLLDCAEVAELIEFDGTVVTAGAAVALPVLARRCVSAGLLGFEWAVGVPGSIGGAVRMNAGGHGSDIAESLIGAQVLDLRDGEQHWMSVEQLGLRFRGSALVDEQVVLSVRLQLTRGDARAAERSLAEIVRWRREHQPGGQNAGSVFVNPIPGELPAAVLIDELGLRGFRVGGAFVSEKHANFIQAVDGATAADVRAVMRHVHAVVLSRTGHDLRSEVRLVGFDDG